MNRAQRTALEHHCRLATETTNPLFAAKLGLGMSRVLTVNSGYE